MTTPEANYSRPICHAPRAIAVRCLFLLSLTIPATGSPAPLAAQDNGGTTIRWWHGAIAVGGVSALMLLDGPVQRYSQHNNGTGADNVAGVVRHFGQPEAYGTITLGLAAAGLISGDSRITRAAGRLGTSLLLAGATAGGAKLLFGRPRPEQSLDLDGYVPFSGQASMPSGHAAMAFALATSLADDIHKPLATVGLYGMATAVAWSRVNDNRHWLSDVGAGALVGITSAKLASGRWRIFGLRAPSVFASPGGMTLGWTGRF